MFGIEFPMLFVAGSVLWWVLLAAAVGLALWALDRESGIGLSSVIVAYFTICALMGDFNIITWTMNNPFVAVGIFVGYIVCGVVWSLFKWGLFVSDCREKFDDMTKDWLASKGIEGSKVPEELKGAFTDYLWGNKKWSYHVGWKNTKSANGRIERVEVRRIRPYPIWRDHKSKVTQWAAAWPLSMIITFCKDFFRVLMRSIMNRLEKVADTISMKQFQDAESNFLDNEAALKRQEEIVNR